MISRTYNAQFLTLDFRLLDDPGFCAFMRSPLPCRRPTDSAPSAATVSASRLPFADALLLRLRGAFDGLLQAERKHLDELANDAQFRTLRDDAAVLLRRTLVDLRGLFRSSFGFDMAEAVGFEREIAQNPAALLRQTERLMANLSRPDLELPPSRYEGVEVTPASIVAQVEPRAAALHKALGDVTQELSNVQGTQVVKDEALETFRQTYVLFLRILQGSFRLAGKQELARRLRRAIPGA